MNKNETVVISVLLVVSFSLSIYFFATGFKRVIPSTEQNSPELALKYLIDDIKESISRERAFFYHIECSPRCIIIRNAREKESELRKAIEAGVQAGIRFKVLVPCDIKESEIIEFLEKGPKIEIRIAKGPISDCFRVSGSSITKEILLLDGEHRKIKRFSYAPNEALLKKNRFEEIWATSRPVS